jgi:hypothetical protein
MICKVTDRAGVRHWLMGTSSTIHRLQPVAQQQPILRAAYLHCLVGAVTDDDEKVAQCWRGSAERVDVRAAGVGGEQWNVKYYGLANLSSNSLVPACPPP